MPVATIQPVLDTLCDDDAPRTLVGTPTSGGRFIADCGNCVQNGQFFPDRAGIGSHLVAYELIDANGCRNAPSIRINVKACRCPTSVFKNVQQNICAGDSVKIKTRFYAVSGTFRDTFRKTDGCDSVIILDLTVRNRDTTRLTAKTCDPSVAGTSTMRILKNVSQCDSVVITNFQQAKRDSTRLNFLRLIASSNAG